MTEKSSPQKKSGRSESLQVLRGLAFVGIFMGHFNDTGWTPVSVSLFFVLSGFLLTLKAGDDDTDVTLSGSFKASVKRIFGLYPLHIFLMLVMIPLTLIAHPETETGNLMINVFCNTFLLQSLVPSAAVAASLNSVSWFLSTMLILYTAFPYMRRAVCRLSKVQALFAGLLACILAQSVIVWAVYSFVPDTDVIIALSHCFPLYRVFDMLCGIFLGRIYMISGEKISASTVLLSVLEIVSVASVALLVYVWARGNMNIYLSHAPVCPVLASLLVILFYVKKGIVSKALTVKPLILLGNRSGSSFLIHFPILFFIRNFIIPDLTRLRRTIIFLILLPGSFALTLLISYFYDRFVKKRLS